MPSANTLEGIAAHLRRATGSEVVFKTVNTRLVLRTGINLNDIRPEQSLDTATVETVKAALGKLGYEIN